MQTLAKIALVAAGGAFGATARFLLNQFFAGILQPFPFVTFFINVTGSFAVGFLLALAAEKTFVNENLRLFLIVGFLGAYTTFSTFEFETLQLTRDKNFALAVFYAAASVIVGFVAAFAGVLIARRI